jgi:hypothetical protein
MPDPLQVALLLPVHDDWKPAGLVLRELDEVFAARPEWTAQAYLLDDGSTQPPGPDDLPTSVRALEAIHTVALRRNLGHQRAIAVGLAHVEARTQADVVVVMDADGEDRPQDVPRLLDELQRLGGQRVVFAERRRRTEGLVFRLGYVSYRILHRLLVGYMQKVGNFSAVPRSQLSRLVVVSELWNHYAAAVFKSRIPLALLPTDRGQRLHGRSRMNLLSLIVHGLSALTVYGEVVGVRLLMAACCLAFSVVLTLCVLLGLGLGADVTIPAWGHAAAGLALVLTAQAASTAFLVAFYLLALRSRLDFVPARDHQVFVGGVTEVARRDA